MAAQPSSAAAVIRDADGISVSEREGEERVARDDGDVLLAVDGVRHGAVHNLAAEAGLPQHGAAARIERVEVALASPREEQIAGSRQDAAVGDVVLREGPLALQRLRVERD